MCGIVGCLAPGHLPGEEVLRTMTGTLAHRGPDGTGLWIDDAAGIALGHRRLAIIDRSEAGAQPMVSRDGRWVLSLNGEVYNQAELRASLASAEPVAWRGHSDTEVFLEAVRRWGIRPALERTVGMFALALWDRQAGQLFLARDRIGEKPLYWCRLGRTLAFASELRALRAHPAWTGRVRPAAVDLLIRYDYIPAPHTVFEEVWKLEPGTILCARPDGGTQVEAYWSAAAVHEAGARDPFPGTLAEAADQLEALLATAVRGQLTSDRPLGAFLSGGLDSSTVVALMRTVADRVRTFTIGFEDAAEDESGDAARVAAHLGTEHATLVVRAGEILDLVPDLPTVYDEPMGDPSQIPTVAVARLARQQVTVALSGDGGDELFGGYPRYRLGHRLEGWTGWMPAPARQGAGRLIRAFVPGPGSGAGVAPAVRYRWAGMAHRLDTTTATDAYHAAMSRWHDQPSPVPGVVALLPLTPSGRRAVLAPGAPTMMYEDLVSYLPDDILVKVDRAAMAVGLETRAPFLDHRIVEFAARLPLGLKVTPAQGKLVLRAVLDRHVPRALVARPKHGFGPPIRRWLHGPLGGWAEDLLAPAALDRAGCFNVPLVRELWRQHQSGARHWTAPIWSILCFQAWHQRWRA